MKLVSYKEVVESGFCSWDFISILRESHEEKDIQIFLAIITKKYSIDELPVVIGLPREAIKDICFVFYKKYFKDESAEKPLNLGWADSGKHVLNPKMGSYKGY